MSNDIKDDGYSVLELKTINETIEITDSHSGDSIKMTVACWDELAKAVSEKMQPYVKPMPTWIDVNEWLPNELKTVLITYEADLNFKPRKFMTFALREGGDWLGIDDIFGGYVFDDEYNADKFNDDLHGFNITHWMPIPEFSTMQNLHKGE